MAKFKTGELIVCVQGVAIGYAGDALIEGQLSIAGPYDKDDPRLLTVLHSGKDVGKWCDWRFESAETKEAPVNAPATPDNVKVPESRDAAKIFKIGDYVVCINPLAGNALLEGGLLAKGELYTVSRTDGTDIGVTNREGKKSNYWWMGKRFVKAHPGMNFNTVVTKDSRCKFRTGDRVHCVGAPYHVPANVAKGQECIVIGYSSSGLAHVIPLLHVLHDGKIIDYAQESCFEQFGAELPTSKPNEDRFCHVSQPVSTMSVAPVSSVPGSLIKTLFHVLTAGKFR